MPLSKQDKDYSLPEITPIDPKLVDVDRVFTNLLPLLKYDGAPLTRGHSKFVTVADLTAAVCRNDALHFQGFSDSEEAKQRVKRWIESDFLSLVHRGKDNQQVAAPLPMHLNTYKLRNPRYCNDSGVADQIFTLFYFGAPDVMKKLRDFLLRGVDYYTDRYDGQADLDIETLLMMRILDQKDQDYPDKRKEPNIHVPLCLGQARILGDDIDHLLAYQDKVPRLVLIGYIKNILSLHVGIYMLRLFQIVPDMVVRGTTHPTCRDCPVQVENPELFEACSFPVHILTDMGEDYHSHMAELARQQFNVHVEQLNTYVRAHLVLRKLKEFGEDLASDGRIERPQSLEEILALRDYDPLELKTYFKARIRSLIASDGDTTPDERLEIIRRLGLSELNTYIEMLYLLRQPHQQSFYIRLLDSLFQKNRETGLMRQGYGRINSKRRYGMGSGLLETIVQIAVLEQAAGDGFRTHTIRVDDFIEWLRRRYGIYISRLPTNREPLIADLEALRQNVQAFKNRLREIGFYTDLSDAYVAQVIRPRYHIE